MMEMLLEYMPMYMPMSISDFAVLRPQDGVITGQWWCRYGERGLEDGRYKREPLSISELRPFFACFIISILILT